MEWGVLDTGPSSAEKNMEIDSHLLEELSLTKAPLLHFYEWEGKSATYGYFIKPEEHLHLEAAKERGVTLARRPTGGGILFHMTDFAFSVLVPASHRRFSLNTLENYAFINGVVLQAIAPFLKERESATLLPNEQDERGPFRHFCMAKPTQYDVMIGQKKVGGAAQRRTKAGFLHQGSLSLKRPDKALLEALLKEPTIMEKMEHTSLFLLPDSAPLAPARTELKALITKAFFVD